jgi:hypothetical protein
LTKTARLRCGILGNPSHPKSAWCDHRLKEKPNSAYYNFLETITTNTIACNI